jgi:branched-chain amino acid transport system permease protein
VAIELAKATAGGSGRSDLVALANIFAVAQLAIVPIELGVIGVVFKYLAIRPLRKRSRMDVALLTFGVAPIVSQLVIRIWGPSTHALAPQLAGSTDLFGQPNLTYRLFLIVVGFGACAALAVWLRFSRLGMYVRAVSRGWQVSQILGARKG